MDLALTILKLLANTIAAALGIAGVLYDFRDKRTKALGRAGIAILTGIAVAGFIAVSISVLEAYREKAASAEQLRRAEKLFKEVRRATQAITRLEVTYWMCFCSDNNYVKSYTAFLSKEIEDRVPDLLKLRNVPGIETEDMRLKGVRAVGYLNEEIEIIEIKKGSPLWPNDKHRFMARLAENVLLNIFVRGKPGDPRKLPLFSQTGKHWDLSAVGVDFDSDTTTLQWNRSEKRLHLVGRSKLPPELWHSNGKIVSFEDLYGAQLVMTFDAPQKLLQGTFVVDPESTIVSAIAASLSIYMTSWRFTDTRSVLIVGEHWKIQEFPDRMRAFVITLPSTEAGFRTLSGE